MEANKINTNNTQAADRAEALRILNEAVESATNPEERATRELLRAYFTNTDFRAFLHETTAKLNGVA